MRSNAQVSCAHARAHGEEGYAFFALRSCHHVLRGDSGEFFSPDYLCSSPPLWCNWTIQVGSGKRIHLELEDFTPADACHLKNDQIHLDESPGSGRHRVLERCWERAVHTTHSNTVHVVLLIGKDPRPPHRGFHARYHALAPSYAQEPPHRGKHKDPNEAKVSVKLLDKSKKMVTGPLVTTFPQTLSPEDGRLSACRLHAGVLLILWLQLAEDFEGEQIYEIVSSALKQLLRKAVRLGPSRRFNSTFVASVSIEDVNECETQLVLCDIHADCINQFGSYVCHCQPGFTGASSFHSRGTDCVDIEGKSSTRSISPVLLQGLCALCFLLGVFLLLLLCIMGVMYRRHHHGVFLVPCQSHSCGDSESSSNTNGNGNYSNNGSNMPPPPIRHPKDRGGNAKDSFPSVGLPLLKFGPLLPSDSVRCREPNEGVKL
uniref:Uncharacterized LOC108933671 n=1 Tax=Scleropages formosus TaxID=113540 RepID=A0A8C9WI38_SCLFO